MQLNLKKLNQNDLGKYGNLDLSHGVNTRYARIIFFEHCFILAVQKHFKIMGEIEKQTKRKAIFCYVDADVAHYLLKHGPTIVSRVKQQTLF